MTASEDLFLSEQHPISRRWAVIEDDGPVVWLYLTESNSRKPVADCWLYNRVPTPQHFDGVRGEQPVVPETHARVGATSPPPAAKSVRLRWSRDGESVAVFFDVELIGFIARGEKRGFSRHIRVSGPFGSVLDTGRFREYLWRHHEWSRGLQRISAPLGGQTVRIIEASQVRHNLFSLIYDFRFANRGVSDFCSRPGVSGGGR